MRHITLGCGHSVDLPDDIPGPIYRCPQCNQYSDISVAVTAARGDSTQGSAATPRQQPARAPEPDVASDLAQLAAAGHESKLWQPRVCAACGYDMSGSWAGGKRECPECGKRLNILGTSAQEREAARIRSWTVHWSKLGLLCLSAAVASVILNGILLLLGLGGSIFSPSPNRFLAFIQGILLLGAFIGYGASWLCAIIAAIVLIRGGAKARRLVYALCACQVFLHLAPPALGWGWGLHKVSIAAILPIIWLGAKLLIGSVDNTAAGEADSTSKPD